MRNKVKFYSLKNILGKDATYNIIFGERSNGKTYSVLEHILLNYVSSGEQGTIIRRWVDDFRGRRGQTMFEALVSNGVIERITRGTWNNITYKSMSWYLSKYDNDIQKNILDETPFCYGFGLTGVEHDKSTSYPNVTTILFDEFLTRSGYLNDEFVLFMNTLSTIIRQRKNVKIFMLGNTVNKYCPYFKEMGLSNIKNMAQGTIDVYSYGDSELKVAVEYSDGISKKGKDSDMYFAFDNPKLAMITGGAWEINIYPHAPCKWTRNNIILTYFINFDDNLLQCEIIQINNMIFTFIHEKTTEIKNENEIVYTPEWSAKPNYKRKITKPTTNIEKKIALFYVKEKVFYQDNEVGEIVRNYLQWCSTDKLK